jgi:hypothetical protein
MNLIYAIIKTIASISLLETEIKTSKETAELGLVKASQSMYSEAFSRYNPQIFRRIFFALLEHLNFSEIPEINALGRFVLFDGSLFPAIANMSWACYKTTHNALKMHLGFELNRMIPVQFVSTDGNGNEKLALAALLESGVTYIADRGYVSFNLFRQIDNLKAFFIIRIKDCIKYVVTTELEVKMPEKWYAFFSDVSDSIIQFSNEKQKNAYRLVTFVAYQETYRIATNRLDLTTGEIIMLYAYRWYTNPDHMDVKL